MNGETRRKLLSGMWIDKTEENIKIIDTMIDKDNIHTEETRDKIKIIEFSK